MTTQCCSPGDEEQEWGTGTVSFLLAGNPAIFYPLYFPKSYIDSKCHWAAVCSPSRVRCRLAGAAGPPSERRPSGAHTAHQPPRKQHGRAALRDGGRGTDSRDRLCLITHTLEHLPGRVQMSAICFKTHQNN